MSESTSNGTLSVSKMEKDIGASRSKDCEPKLDNAEGKEDNQTKQENSGQDNITGANDSEDDDSEEEEEDDGLSGLSPEDVLEKGKALFRAKDYAQAAEILSKALEKKVQDINGKKNQDTSSSTSEDSSTDSGRSGGSGRSSSSGSCSNDEASNGYATGSDGASGEEWDIALAQYYLWFGDALLTKEEQSNELFQFLKPGNNPLDPQNLRSLSSGSSSNSSSSSSSGGRSGSSSSSSSTSSSSDGSGTGSSSTSNSDSSRSNEGISSSDGNGTTHGISSSSNSGSSTNSNSSSACSGPGEDAASGENEEITDEQLAFEILEMARKTYTKKVNLRISSEGPQFSDVEDLSFVHIRLADIHLTNERYEEAAEEYKEAIRYREEYNCPETSVICPSVSLGQALMFCSKYEPALETFKKALSLLERVLNGTLEAKNVCVEDYRDTAEDLRLQIEELERRIKEVDEKGLETSSGSQTEASKLIPQTTSTFDKAQLPQSEFAPLNLGVVRSSKPASTPTTSTSCESPSTSGIGGNSNGSSNATNTAVMLNGSASNRCQPEDDIAASSDGKGAGPAREPKKRRIDLNEAVKAMEATAEEHK